MAGEQNVETAKRAYAAFSAGDAQGAMANIADDVEWITPGTSVMSGVLHGKQDVGALWAKLARPGARRRCVRWRGCATTRRYASASRAAGLCGSLAQLARAPADGW
jgi:SnoaL-like domain